MFPEPAPYLDSAQAWIADVLQEHVWSKQVQICESVVNNKYTAVKACHGPGKSFIASRIGAWWLNTHKLGDAFLVTTAPSWPQVQAILWREMRRAHRIGHLPGRITLECQWYMGEGRSDEELIAMGRKPADYDETAFQGLHARYILIILDEACGIPMSLWTAVKTLATNDNARILAIGNPDDPGTEFAQCCKEGTDWNVITISAFDTPNFTGEHVPQDLAEKLVTPSWVEERRKDWGEGSPLWVSKVLGEFPDISDEYLITPAMINKGVALNLPGIEKGRYGADIARFGTDKSVVYRNRGGVIRLVDAWGMTDTMRTTGKINVILKQHWHLDQVPLVIDVVGVGAGVYDRLKEQGHQVVPFSGAERAFHPDKFKNRRAELYWGFRTLLDDELIDLDPEDGELLTQLQSIKWWVDSGGRIQIESKEDMKKRGVKSPDLADACVYSTAHNTPMAVMALPGSLAHDLLQMKL
jgi:sorbitol-specific phosphotransferase system component IIA